ncbi:uncharacterized protein BDZ99DRAFT_453183 [Mytilinidion resinicola]|uniref:Uncharacterized protein n=1 Tax=Mytilinidion resinicola TaxID=574789 RepID=A0A6A6Y4S1_9PEZI|nr:uncharacterized protein BDZ99DRAFT_453183 [Mytilinidion resinicola]KAF2803513.1 hypothetical protein BDZ99DRAFT_453183 [Mytilinidion resinicola]
MLPPIDPSTLEQNPGFSALYKDLTTRKFNPDGSSKDLKRQRAHAEVQKKLQTARIEAAKSQILRASLVDLPSKSDGLPPELHEVIEIICAQLNGQIPPEDRDILQDDTEYFLENIAPVSAAVSANLTATAEHLTRIANPLSSDPLDPTILPSATLSLLDANIALTDDLTTTRHSLATLAATLLTTHTTLLTSLIRILEQTVHGAVSRGTRAHAEQLAVKADVLNAQASIHALTHPLPAPLAESLQEYSAAMEKEHMRLKTRERAALKMLKAYEDAGAKGMAEIAERFAEVGREVERVRGEIERLEQGGK